jgi:hypothetical protein
MKTTIFSELNFGDRFQHREKGHVSSIFVKLVGRNARCEVGDGSNFNPEEAYEFGDCVGVEVLRNAISPEALGVYGEKTSTELLGYLITAGNKLLPSDKPDVIDGIGPVELEGSGEDLSINLCKWGVTLQPEAMLFNSIGGTVALPGWGVTVWKTVSNYPHEPDDVQDHRVGTVGHTLGAARLAIETVFSMICDCHFETEGNKLAVEQWKEDERLAKEYADQKS